LPNLLDPALGVLGLAIVIAERETGTEFSQIVSVNGLAARHAERLQPRCSAIDEDEPHAAFLSGLVDMRLTTMQIETMAYNETPEIRPLLHPCGVCTAI
jgi:hypothetical protein